jgi:hypothetical protein
MYFKYIINVNTKAACKLTGRFLFDLNQSARFNGIKEAAQSLRCQ